MANIPPRTTSRLLIDESPLQVLPSLAVAIGLNEALVLQQVHYWLKSSKHEVDGRRWIYNTLEAWHTQFPFFSVSTIRRTLISLRERGLLLSANHNEAQTDRTLWYSIDYAVLESLHIEGTPETTPSAQNEHMPSPSAQNEQMEVSKMSTSSAQNGHMLKEQRVTPETTQRSGGVARSTENAAAAVLNAAGKTAQEQHELINALKTLGMTAEQRRKILAAQPEITVADVDAWLPFLQTPPPWCTKPEGFVYKGLVDGNAPPVERARTANGRPITATSVAPDYDIHEAIRRGAARKAELLEGLPEWA
jgi:hypothetical protein